MENVPFFVSLVFVITTALTFLLFLRACSPPKTVAFGFIFWLILQACLAQSGFYLGVSTEPFRFLLAAPPTILCIVGVFVSKKGRRWIETLPIERLTALHTIRIPVEMVLYWFFLYKMVPELMTFSGRNFDIVAGITAPFMYYFVFKKKMLGRRGLLLWNLICLGLLIAIIFNAVLAAPTSFQQFAFDQPNLAILHFPLVWLPTFVVPIVLFSHFVVIYRLLQSKSIESL